MYDGQQTDQKAAYEVGHTLPKSAQDKRRPAQHPQLPKLHWGCLGSHRLMLPRKP